MAPAMHKYKPGASCPVGAGKGHSWWTKHVQAREDYRSTPLTQRSCAAAQICTAPKFCSKLGQTFGMHALHIQGQVTVKTPACNAVGTVVKNYLFGEPLLDLVQQTDIRQTSANKRD